MLVVFLLLSHTTPGIANGINRKGSTCTEIGKTISVGKNSLICQKHNKKLIWRKLQLPISKKPEVQDDSIKAAMQKIIEGLPEVSNKVNIDFFFIAEEGENGPYQREIESLLIPTASIMEQISGFNPYKRVYILIGRSQDWLRKQRSSICGNNSYFEVVAAVSSNCSLDSEAGIIEINLPGVVTEKYLQADSKVDLKNYSVSSFTLERIRNLLPHEYFHFWQSKLQIRSAPSWFIEGSAQVFSLIVRAKVDQKNRRYSQIFESWFTKEDIKYSQDRCTSSISNVTFSMESQCQYIQGLIPVEILLSKYSGFETFKSLMDINSKKSFELAFEESTGTSLNSFYTLVDDYAFTLGWKSGR